MVDKLSEMETFARVVEAGTITAAAEQLGVAKSAVSKRLSDLEARLGVQLLARTTRRITLTDPGRSFLSHATEILAAIDIAESSTAEKRALLQGRLRISSPLTFGLMHLNPAIREFTKRHPAIEIDIDFSDARVDLFHGGYDLALRIADLSDSGLAARPITKIRRSVTASPEYFAERAVPRTPQDLLGLECLCFSQASNTQWVYTHPSGEKGSVNPRARINANNGAFLRDMAIAGSGVVNLPTFVCYQAISSGDLVEVLKDYRWHEHLAYAVYPKTRYLPLRVRAFIDFIAGYFDREIPYWDQEIESSCQE